MITYKKFIFEITAKEKLILPPYKGSTLRGGFGIALKRVVCVLKRENCIDCVIKTTCIYSYIFESFISEKFDFLKRYSSKLHPFIIEPPLEEKEIYNEGETLNFNLILIGKGLEYFPYFVYSFKEMGEIGIGKGRRKFLLSSIFSEEDKKSKKLVFSNDTIYSYEKDNIPFSDYINSLDNEFNKDLEDKVIIKFLTPTRIRYHGHFIDKIDFKIFLQQIERRLFLLRYFYNLENDKHYDKTLEDRFHQFLNNDLPNIKIISSNLYWKDWKRYSHRQKDEMILGGFVGEITFQGSLKRWLPFIKAGSILHVGKGTSFGLGRYEIINDG